MPCVTPAENVRVLVTGANGYLAMWIIKALLDQGYAVRGTVRSKERAKDLQDYFNSYSGRAEWVIVEDITKEGAYDEVVKNVNAIEHLASPSKESTDDPDEFIKPAVDGTLSILRSALKFGNKLQRIILTSSISAIIRPVADSEPFVIFDENDWSDEFVEAVKRKGSQSSFVEKYYASKNLAERGAWNFYHQHKANIAWDLVVLNPGLVIGAGPIQDFKDLESLPKSLSIWYQNIFENQSDDLLKAMWEYVDIQDVKDAHIEALKKEEAAGERIILCAGASTWQDSRNLIFSARPELYSGNLSRGNPDLPRRIAYQYGTEKGKNILGVQYKSPEDTILSMAAYFETRGWLRK